MFKKLIQKIKNWCKRYIDYDIVGEYYDSDGKGHYTKKYNRKCYLKFGKKKYAKIDIKKKENEKL